METSDISLEDVLNTAELLLGPPIRQDDRGMTVGLLERLRFTEMPKYKDLVVGHFEIHQS